MRINTNFWNGITGIAATGLVCGSLGLVQGQRAGGRRAAAGQTGSTASCPGGGASSSATSTTTTQTHSGTTAVLASGTSQALAQRTAAASATASAQSTNGFTATRTAANRALVSWRGATVNAQRVYIGVVDANGQVIDQRALTQPPVQASLNVTSAARYYGVRIFYADGTYNTYYSPVR